jgi:hypothetical protein
LQAHCQSPTSQRTKQSFVKELAKPTQTKLFLKNFPALQKNKNTPTHSPTNTAYNDTKINIDKAYNYTADRRPAGNSGFAKKRVQWLIKHSTSHQLLCYVDSLVLRNPLLRKAAKR